MASRFSIAGARSPGSLWSTAAALPALAALSWACGSPTTSKAPANTAESSADLQMTMPVADMGQRTIVANVDGAPIYDDCVTIQATEHRGDRRAALNDCIDFHLLARAAAERGFVGDVDVGHAAKVAMVRRLIDADFRARYRDADDVDEAQLAEVYDRMKPRYQRPEIRETSFLRLPVAEEDTDSPADTRARDLMQRVYERLADRHDLTPEAFHQVVLDVVGTDEPLQGEKVQPFHRQGLIVKPYRDATFAIPETGMVSAPVRTKWGWDIILLMRIYPQVDVPLDEAKPELFAIARRQLFTAWVDELAAKSRIRIDQDALAQLQSNEEEARFAAP